MSLDDLNLEIETCRVAAAAIAENYVTTHTRVTSDPTLTPQGQRDTLAPLHQELTEDLAALSAREKAAVRTAKERLQRRVFGLAPSASRDTAQIVSYRDAQSRARELTDRDDAEALYESALRSGDNILATAVLEQALVHGWTTIKKDFLERHPKTGGDLDDLTEIAKYEHNSLSRQIHYMAPDANLPAASAGFPALPRTASAAPTSIPSLADVMSQRVSQGYR